MALFHSAFETIRQYFSKHQANEANEAEKSGSLFQDHAEDIKLERNTGIAAERKPGNDIEAQLQSHATERLSWTSVMCRMGFVKCENCTRHRALKNERDKHQDQATNGVNVSVGLCQPIQIEIRVVVQIPSQDETYYNLVPLFAGYPLPLVCAMALCYDI